MISLAAYLLVPMVFLSLPRVFARMISRQRHITGENSLFVLLGNAVIGVMLVVAPTYTTADSCWQYQLDESSAVSYAWIPLLGCVGGYIAGVILLLDNLRRARRTGN